MQIHFSDLNFSFSPQAFTILLASSDEKVLRFGGGVLRGAGFKVITCQIGMEVIAQFSNLPPILLVIDEQTEQLDGISTIDRLYEDIRFRRSPLMFLTRKAGEYPLWATRQDIQGAVVFLSLPFNLAEFLSFVSRCVQGIIDGVFPTTNQEFPCADSPAP